MSTKAGLPERFISYFCTHVLHYSEVNYLTGARSSFAVQIPSINYEVVTKTLKNATPKGSDLAVFQDAPISVSVYGRTAEGGLVHILDGLTQHSALYVLSLILGKDLTTQAVPFEVENGPPFGEGRADSAQCSERAPEPENPRFTQCNSDDGLNCSVTPERFFGARRDSSVPPV